MNQICMKFNTLLVFKLIVKTMGWMFIIFAFSNCQEGLFNLNENIDYKKNDKFSRNYRFI